MGSTGGRDGLLLSGQAVDAKADKKETKWKLVWSDEFQAKTTRPDEMDL